VYLHKCCLTLGAAAQLHLAMAQGLEMDRSISKLLLPGAAELSAIVEAPHISNRLATD